MKMNYRLFFKIIVIAFISLSIRAIAQPVPDNRGTEFWLAFPPNYHNSIFSQHPSLKKGDTISVFVAGESKTTGNIEYRDRFGNVQNQAFTLDAPDYFFEFKTNYNDYEIIGINNGGIVSSPNFSDSTSPQYFKVTSDKDVSVYANSQAWYTSDAWMSLPTDALGKQYMIMSYYSDGSIGGIGDMLGSSTPSQFLIIAPFDNTVVEIIPSAPTIKHDSAYTVTLNKGDVYLVQNRIYAGHAHDDLTGTVVNSSQPVAIISGHQRSAIPIGSGVSRDVLIEQLQPLDTWGFNAIVTPFIQDPSVDNTFDTDLCRILAAYDSTEVYFGNSTHIILNHGEFYEFPLTEPVKLEATNRIQVAVFKKSGTDNIGNLTTISDPFMVILPQVEQYNKSYTFVNVQTREIERTEDNEPIGASRPSYRDHYVTIIAHDTVTGGITLDGNKITGFLKVPNSEFSYVNKSVKEGIHHINAPGPFSATVYGYGYANSYGYLAGMNYVAIKDTNIPQLAYNRECFELAGTVTDTLGFDSGITKVTIDSLNNATGSVEPFTGDMPTVKYNLQLVDRYKDGSAYIVAQDSIGLKTRRHVDLPGFTLAVITSKNYTDPDVFESWGDTLPGYKNFCRNVTIFNYGKFNQNLHNITLKNGSGSITYTFASDTVIKPGKQYSIKICKPISSDTVVIDTLYIESDCGIRPILALNLRFLPDRDAPRLNDTLDACKHNLDLIISDSLSWDSGIDTIIVDRAVNLDYIIDYDTLISKVYCAVRNPFEDSYIKVTARDIFGLESTYEKGIPGYTLSFGSLDSLINGGTDSIPSGITKKYTFDTTTIGAMNCDTLKIYNYGNYTFVLDEGFLSQNTIFSLPLSQFPITIPPKSTADLIFCYTPFLADTMPDVDSLIMWGNCIPKLLPMEGSATGLLVTGDSKCYMPITFSTDSTTQQATFMEQAPPQPARQTLNLKVNVPEDETLSIILFDVNGNSFHLIDNMNARKGSYNLNIDVSKLSRGLYLGVMQYGSGAVSSKILIGE